MILLDDLRARKLVHAWQEAVAIVQELAATVGRAGAAAEVPDLGHVAVDLNGQLVILPGNPPSDQPGQQLAQALQSLIDGTAAPAELHRIVSENACEKPTCASVEEFSRALAVFERPNRRADIASVVARDPNAEAQSNLESELERLKARARQAAEARANAKQDGASPHRRARHFRRTAAIAASVLVLFGAAAVPAAFWLGSDDRGPGALPVLRALVSRAGDRLALIAQAGVKAVIPLRDRAPVSVVGESRQPAVASAPVAEGSVVERPRARPFNSLSDTASEAGAQGPLESSPADDPQSLIQSRSGVADSGPPETWVRPVIYTPADADVEPAVMLRQYLPSVTNGQITAAPGELDIVISETGEVEYVRLVSTTNRFQERMLVSAAKAWRFRPAFRGGRPVKYRIRVRVTM